MSPLFPFNLIIDTDFGLIKLISKEYRADIFDKSILDADDRTIMALLLARPFENPLSILAKYTPENKEELDKYYKEFMGTRYMDIIKQSALTKVGQYFMGLYAFEEATPYVYCRFQEEERFINFFCKDCRYEIVNNSTNKLVIDNKYDPIFMKTGFDYIECEGSIHAHVIYLARYGFNVQYDEDGTEFINYDKSQSIFKEGAVKVRTMDIYDPKALAGNKEKGDNKDE
jgi:hypothetical protein